MLSVTVFHHRASVGHSIKGGFYRHSALYAKFFLYIVWKINEGASAICYRRGEETAVFRVRQTLRADAVETVAALKARGYAIEIVSGDSPRYSASSRSGFSSRMSLRSA